MSRLPTRLAPLAAVAMTLAAVATTLGGCDAAGSAPAHASQHDGRTLFQGIVFGAGPAADVLPELWGAERPRRDVEAVAVEAFVLDALGRDPGFYPRFRTALTSGDPLTVASMLDESGALATSALGTYPDPAVARAFARRSASVEAGAVVVAGTAVWTYAYAYRTLLATHRGSGPASPGGNALDDRPALERELIASRLADRLRASRNAAL